jgi:AcrR family transcriptional regulator
MDRKRIWLDKGLDEVIELGIDGFNIDVLSAKVRVAKTSFYYFFRSRENFLNELIDYWSTQLLDETLRSITDCTDPLNINKFLKHKKRHIRFYCMYILAKASTGNKNDWASTVDRVENRLWTAMDGFIAKLIGSDNLFDQAKSMIHTFLTGWDYLHAYNVFKSSKLGVNSLKELEVFLTSYESKESSQSYAS